MPNDDLWSRRDVLAFGGAAGLSSWLGIRQGSGAFLEWPTVESAYEKGVLASRPAGYWRLGEMHGSTASDGSGRGHNGRYVGHPHLGQPGAIAADPDRAVGLEGPKTKSYVEIPDSTAFSVAHSGHGLTVEVWMRPDVLDFAGEKPNAKDAYIHWLGKGEKGQFEWGFRFYSRHAGRPNRISAYIWNPDGKLGAGAYVEEPLVPHRWICLVATFDDPSKPNARVQLYKDGKPSPHNHSPGTLYQSYRIRPKHGHAPVRLGTRDLHSILRGGLDEVAIYPRVLKPDEILRHCELARRDKE